jgi:hypothetical protein
MHRPTPGVAREPAGADAIRLIVLWFERGAPRVAAFEAEHTTSILSGMMLDLATAQRRLGSRTVPGGAGVTDSITGSWRPVPSHIPERVNSDPSARFDPDGNTHAPVARGSPAWGHMPC